MGRKYGNMASKRNLTTMNPLLTVVLKGGKFTLYVWKWVVVVMFPLVFTICAKFLGSQVKKIRHSRRTQRRLLHIAVMSSM